ncbi:MAG: GTP 3',8-cyclase MoaA [Pseudomonadales bacterium]
MTTSTPTQLIDRFGRQVDYVRLSVTDRCDFRCVYCMAEDMEFLPRKEILSLEEISRIAKAFIRLGVSKIRLTGGEPLVRKNVVSLASDIAATPGLSELNITSNGSQLRKQARALRSAGVNRLNISLDSLQAERFNAITRTGKLDQVLDGIDAAREAGFDRIKINAVILNGRNEDEVLDLLQFCIERDLDIAYIEEMPLGLIDEHDRAVTYCSSDDVRSIISQRHQLFNSTASSAGPSDYYHLTGSPIRVGFISPHSHNFCHLCNRVRVTVEGRLLLCLGNEHSMDLRAILRDGASDTELEQAITSAMDLKPERHHFNLHDEPQIVRFMNMTGG